MKKLIVTHTTANCYPSLSMGVVSSKEDFDYFISNKFIIQSGVQFTWEELTYREAAHLERILNTSQMEHEFLLRVLEN